MAHIVITCLHCRVKWFLKLTMFHVGLDWRKISKTILEKAFFVNFWRFSHFRFLSQKILNMTIPRGEFLFLRKFIQSIKKSRILCWTQIRKLVFVKNTPQKLKLINLSLILLSPIFMFFNLGLFGGYFVTDVRFHTEMRCGSSVDWAPDCKHCGPGFKSRHLLSWDLWCSTVPLLLVGKNIGIL
jgi:hypothetical protein